MVWAYACIRLITGFLIGLTGVGGGAIMTPILVLTGWARPLVAIGTDLVWGMITKAVGAVVHFRRHTINLSICKRLVVGSVPGTLLGVAAIAYMRRVRAAQFVDHISLRVLGLALIVVACTMLMRSISTNWFGFWTPQRKRQRLYTAVLGLLIGVLVGMTSVGSGSLVLAFLVVLYPREKLSNIVGTDLFHSLILTSVGGLAHLYLGTVNIPLLAGLLIGSVPGVWLGSRLSVNFPERLMRPVLATLLLATGCRLL